MDKKIKNLSKQYILRRINILTNNIKQKRFNINTCHTMIDKIKPKLNNSKVSQDELWYWRDELKESIFLLRRYKDELKEYQKIFTLKYNFQPRKNDVIFDFGEIINGLN